MFTVRQFRNRYALHCQMLRIVQQMKSETGQVQKKPNLNQRRQRRTVRTVKFPLVSLRASVEDTRILSLPRAQLSYSRPTFRENARVSLLSRAACGRLFVFSLKKRLAGFLQYDHTNT